MVDFRELFSNPKRLAIAAASGIAYYLLRNRMLPENPIIDAAAAGGAYLGSRKTTGNVKAALEGLTLGAGASLAITLAKKAPEVFAAAPAAGAPAAAPQIPQIVVQVPQPPQPQPPQPFIAVSPQILLSQSQTVSQAQQVSQQVSQMVSQLQSQLQLLAKQIEDAAKQAFGQQPAPSQPSPEEFMPLPSVFPDLSFQPPVWPRDIWSVGLPVMPPEWSPEEGIGIRIPIEPTGSPTDFAVTGEFGVTGMVKVLQ